MWMWDIHRRVVQEKNGVFHSYPSFFQYLKSPFGALTAQGHIPHLSPWEMIRTAHWEILIPRASWKPDRQPMASSDPKLQKYGDAAPKTVWRWTTRPKKTHKGRHSSLFKGCFLWFRSNRQCHVKRQREREIYEAHRKSLVHLSLSFCGWKAILLVDWRMMLLLREQLHQPKEREERAARASSPGCSWADGWAVKCPIVQITQQARCHRQGLIYSGTPPFLSRRTEERRPYRSRGERRFKRG